MSHPKDLSLKKTDSFTAHLLRYHGDDETQIQFETKEIDGREITLPTQQWYSKNVNHRQIIIQPDTSLSNMALVNGQKIEFDVQSDVYNVRSMALHFIVRNSSADTAQLLCPLQLVIDKIKLLGNGQKECQIIHGHELFLNDATFKTTSQIKNEKLATNLTEALVAGVSIPAGSTQEYFLALPDILPKDGNVDGVSLFNINRLKLQVEFRGKDAIQIDSSAGDKLPLLLEGLYLILDTTHYTRQETSALNMIYKDGISYKYLYYNRQSFDMNLDPSKPYSFKLNNIQGLSPFMWITLHRQGFGGQDLYNPPTIIAWIDTITWKTDNGISQTNSVNYKGDYLKFTQQSQKLDNTFGFDCRNSYFISFGPNPVMTYLEGIHGGYDFISDTVFEITTKSSLIAGAYTVRFIVPTYALLHITPSGMITNEV